MWRQRHLQLKKGGTGNVEKNELGGRSTIWTTWTRKKINNVKAIPPIRGKKKKNNVNTSVFTARGRGGGKRLGV